MQKSLMIEQLQLLTVVQQKQIPYFPQGYVNLETQLHTSNASASLIQLNVPERAS